MPYPGNSDDLTDSEARQIVAEIVASTLAPYADSYAEEYVADCRKAQAMKQPLPEFKFYKLLDIQSDIIKAAQTRVRIIRGLDLSPIVRPPTG